MVFGHQLKCRSGILPLLSKSKITRFILTLIATQRCDSVLNTLKVCPALDTQKPQPDFKDAGPYSDAPFSIINRQFGQTALFKNPAHVSTSIAEYPDATEPH